MKVLLDECVSSDLRPLLTGHDVFTVGFLGWKGTSNGALLRRAAENGFDVMITTDHAVEDQQNKSTLPLAVIIIRVSSNRISSLVPHVPSILKLLSSSLEKTFHCI